MDINEIRKKFIDFFLTQKHKQISAAPVVNKNDPTLMFTNAGMNQFKSIFINTNSTEDKRVFTLQPCLRVSGKHNDLEDVGIDTYHHTLFEMIGNWSFGDYFKKEAIAFAWELITDVYKIDKNRIYVTTFGGDSDENLNIDNESYEIWKNFISEDRIINNCTKKDNFWEMGDVGPCGPCTEIHIDMRSDDERKNINGKSLVNKDHPEVIEIWNLVFIEFERLSNGSLRPLPNKSVDTGMGLERLTAVLQNKKSTYDTDIFRPLITHVEQKSGIKYSTKKETDIAIRVIVDHIRAIIFCIADGEIPSNNKAGYVVKRILRRAVRYGYTFLNFKKPFLYEIIDTFVHTFGNLYDNVNKQHEYIKEIVFAEETNFLRTLETGLNKIHKIIEHSTTNNISGSDAFELYDTYGFPLDLTSLIAKENGLIVDILDFEQEMKIQKNRSKNSAKVEFGDWIKIYPDLNSTEFCGYSSHSSTTNIIMYRTYKSNDEQLYQLVLSKTPFYPQGGGQIGDTGTLQNDTETIDIINTKKDVDLIIHETTTLPKNLHTTFFAIIDSQKRQKCSQNHTATHLLHKALKEFYGSHVDQKGSFVSHNTVRLDFSLNEKIDKQAIQAIENLVNNNIRANLQKTELLNVPIDEAKKMGATALFSEKYGDLVRVISFGDNYSIELCGGTHTSYTGNIGIFKIVSFSSISSGVKRIEAVTGEEAEKFINQKINLLNDISTLLKHPKELFDSVDNLLADYKKSTKTIEEYELQLSKKLAHDIITTSIQLEQNSLAFYDAQNSKKEFVKKIVSEICTLQPSALAAITYISDTKTYLALGISKNSKHSLSNLSLTSITNDLSKNFNFNGGGNDNFITLCFNETINHKNLYRQLSDICKKHEN